jgi:hypothetical protein
MQDEWEDFPWQEPVLLPEAEAECKCEPCEGENALAKRAGSPWLGETKLSEVEGVGTNGEGAFTKAVIHCAKKKAIPPLETEFS